MMRNTLIALVLSFIAAPVVAQPPPPPRPAPPVAAVDPTVPSSPFGLGWGGGIGASDNLNSDLVRQESGVILDADGVVRFVGVENIRPRVLVESHYTWKLPWLGDSIAFGPAMWLQLAGGASADLFNAMGGGGIIELGDGPTSFNILIGGIVDFGVRRLHPMYIDGLPPPVGGDFIFVEREELQLFVGFAVGR